MAWGKKLEKQDLIDAGIDPDLLQQLKEKGVTKEELATLKSDILASVNTTINDTIKNSFTELEAKLAPKANPNNNNNNNNNDNNNNNNQARTPEEEMADYLANPTEYIKRQVGSVGIGAALEFKRMARNLAYGTLSTRLAGFKNAALKEEIDKEWEKYTPEVLARNNGDPEKLLQSVHDMVMGRHMEDIQRDANKKDGKYNLVSGSTGAVINNNGGVNNGGGADDKPELSADEKAQAAKFGMTEDEWRKQGDDMAAEELTRKKAPVLA